MYQLNTSTEVPCPTLIEVWTKYQQYRKLRDETLKGYRTNFRKLAVWHSYPINRITKQMVEDEHARMSVDAPGHSNSAMRLLRTLCNFAQKYYELEDGSCPIKSNPVDRLNAIGGWNPTKPRITEYISEDDVGPWFRAVKQLTSRTASDYLTFLLLTGVRCNEASKLTWDKVNLKSGIILLYPDDTKNGMPHEFPVSDHTLAILRERRMWAPCEYVFTSKKNPYKPMCSPYTAVEIITDRTNIKFTPHGLRRTFSRIIGHPEVAGEEIAVKGLLNHKDGSVTWKHYFQLHPERMRPTVQGVTDFVLKRANYI